MKTLDLNAYRVSEMNKQEMVETDGGVIVGTITLGPLVGILMEILENAEKP